ncbi:hypothetical protein LJR034_008607 [Caballeronia sp. LjRoot34]|uniref:hypothetical protein n=1 Tax=Caballeronia sp. LjRoot34 TaxID=3342325 RepID=UPI003ECF92BB
MTIFDTLMHLDWTRAVRFWLLVAAAVALWEAAVLLRRGMKLKAGKENSDA